LECGKSTVRRMVQKCVKAGWIGERGDVQFRRYEATERGEREAENRPSAYDWT